jgi:uncharacterized protein
MFGELIDSLPFLGVGISGEYGTRPHIEPLEFIERWKGLVHFVEYGSDIERGLDSRILRWVEQGQRATYHFLDINLEETEDLDEEWLTKTTELASKIGSPWICGDSGLWHFGPRDRGHGLLLPPVLSLESAEQTAQVVSTIQEKTGFLVLPENPPSLYYLGTMHILEYFAKVAELCDCGLLLDAAHLAIFQKARGLSPLDGLDNFPLDRVIELHVAGGGEASTPDGYQYIDDDHRAHVHADVWTIVESLIERLPNLKAIAYECEHNAPEDTVETFQRLNGLFPFPETAGRAVP